MNPKSRKKFFWIVLFLSLLLSGGYISATAADGHSNLIINEFVAANSTGLIDEDGDSSDWIEIYNQGPLAINLAGWALTDDPEQPQKWMFPDMTLGSGEYLVVFASGKNRRATTPEAALHTNFKLSRTGDFLGLHNLLEGRFMDVISPRYPEQLTDLSYGRYGEELAFGYLARPTPGQPNEETESWAGSIAPVTFSPDRGLFDRPVTVELASSAGATIRYTTDGAKPTASHGTVYTEPITIEQTTLLRATAFKPGYLPAEVTTHSYILVDEASLRPPAPAPTQTPHLTQVMASYQAAMKAAGEAGFKDSLQSIPSLSLVLEDQNLADLYAYAGEGGKDSERPVSVELIQPDGADSGFQVEGGIRLQGMNAASKPSFRLYFRNQYGPTRLDYPIFSDSSVESYDTLLLRPGPAAASPTPYLRSQWLWDSQKAMSNIGVHGSFVHLYLNGMYWGLYNLTEKPNADFMASYLGGTEEDWFVADRTGPLENGQGPQVDKLNYLFTSIALAERVGGELAQPDYLEKLYGVVADQIDPAQLIDYVILNWYAQSLDWPAHNWYAVVRLQDLPGQGKFLMGEELPDSPAPSGFGFTGDAQPDLAQQLFEISMGDPDFRIQFADRLYQHLLNDGPLTDANAQDRWLRLESLVEQAFAAEAVRWESEPAVAQIGPAPVDQPVLNRLEGQAARLLRQARQAGYYPFLDPPRFNQESSLVEAGFEVRMALPDSVCQNCRIYYTTDGTDPRLPVTGEVSPGAMAYEGPIRLTENTQIKARVWQEAAPEQAWSALHEATFSVMAQNSNLRLTEIMYNPVGGDDYEFLELQNMGHTPVELANISIDEGVRFTFPPNAPALGPDQFAVLVSNPTAFAERYPAVAITGAYEGHLSNKGEKILLNDAAGNLLIEIEYNDEYGWPVSPDGRGDSLNLVNPDGNPNDPRNWRASPTLYGSPGAAERETKEIGLSFLK